MVLWTTTTKYKQQATVQLNTLTLAYEMMLLLLLLMMMIMLLLLMKMMTNIDHEY